MALPAVAQLSADDQARRELERAGEQGGGVLSLGPLSAAEREALEARRRTLFDAVFERPGDLDLMFEYAQLAARLGDVEVAISTLERMLVFNPDLPRVRLELGVLYFRLQSYQAARTYLEQARDADDVPPRVRARVEVFLAEIERRSSRHRFFPSVLAGVRVESNANAAPSGGTVFVSGLPIFTLADEDQADEDVSVFASASLRHEYDLGNQAADTWNTEVVAYQSLHRQFHDLDVGVVDIATGPRISLAGQGFGEGAFIRPRATLTSVMLNKDTLYTSGGGGLLFGMPLGERTFGQLDVAARYRDFDNTKRVPNNSTNTGAEFLGSGTVRYAYSQALSADVTLGARRDESRDDAEESTELNAAVGVNYRFDAPLEGLPPWQVRGAAEWRSTVFDAPDATVHPGIRRHDSRVRVYVQGVAPLDNTWAALLTVERVVNDSNLLNFGYNNNSVTFAVSGRF